MTHPSGEVAAEYKLQVENWLWRGMLIGSCLLVFIVAMAIFITLIGLGWLSGEWPIGLGVCLWFGAPIVMYFALRNRTRDTVIVVLTSTAMEIRRKGENLVLQKDSIQSYESYIEDSDEYDAESVIVRTTDGKSYKLTTSYWWKKNKEMAAFRKDFDIWAKALQLTQWAPWYRRNFFGKG